MRLNLTTDYALRIIRTIYLTDKKVVTTKTICEKDKISQGVIMKILRRLKEYHIVESHQGRGNNVGGFSLAADLEDLTLCDIVEAMEGPIYFSFPRDSGYRAVYGAECTINKELLRVNRTMQEELRRHSLYEVLVGEENKNESVKRKRDTGFSNVLNEKNGGNT